MKNHTDPEDSLPGIEPKFTFRLGPFERAEALEPLIGLNETQLRNFLKLQRPNGEPWIPKPNSAEFDTCATIRGLIEYHQHRTASRALPTYPNIRTAAEATGISAQLLREWKRCGCPGFRTRGDVVLADVLPWLEGWLLGKSAADSAVLESEGVSTWDEYRMKFQALNERLKNQELRGEVIPKSVATETVREIVGVCETLLQKISAEYPTLLEGRDKHQIRSIVERDCRERRLSLRATFEKRAEEKRAAANPSPEAA